MQHRSPSAQQVPFPQQAWFGAQHAGFGGLLVHASAPGMPHAVQMPISWLLQEEPPGRRAPGRRRGSQCSSVRRCRRPTSSSGSRCNRTRLARGVRADAAAALAQLAASAVDARPAGAARFAADVLRVAAAVLGALAAHLSGRAAHGAQVGHVDHAAPSCAPGARGAAEEAAGRTGCRGGSGLRAGDAGDSPRRGARTCPRRYRRSRGSSPISTGRLVTSRAVIGVFAEQGPTARGPAEVVGSAASPGRRRVGARAHEGWRVWPVTSAAPLAAVVGATIAVDAIAVVRAGLDAISRLIDRFQEPADAGGERE